MFAGKKSAQIREILINESAWEEMTCLFAPSLNMMIESGEQYTHASLEAAIKARFGEQARFHTCSAEGMTAGELVAFLAAKGKFIPSKDGFSTDQSKICRH